MTDIKAAAAGVWKAFGSRNADEIRAVLTEDAAWYAPRRNATQVALGLPPELLESREGIASFLRRTSGDCSRKAPRSRSRAPITTATRLFSSSA